MKLIGSEKQIAWAEDIKKEWRERAKVISERINAKPVKITRKTKDPLSGQETEITIEQSDITEAQKNVIGKAQKCFEDKDNPTRYINEKPDHLRDLVAKIERALETETDAKFWIERR